MRIVPPAGADPRAASGGAVTFTLDGRDLVILPVSGGVATLPYLLFTPGQHRLGARYSGGTLWPPGEAEIVVHVIGARPKTRAVRK